MNFKSLILVILVLLVCAGGLFALYSWPEDPNRVGNAAVLQAMDIASRKMAAAQNYLDAPAHLIKGQYEQFEGTADDLRKKPVSETDISFPEEYSPNPVALDTAKAAESELVAVLAKHPAANPELLSMGNLLAGRLAAMQGFYYTSFSNASRLRANADRRTIVDLVHVTNVQAGEIEVHKVGAALSLEEAEKALADAKADLEKATQDIETKKGEIAAAQSKWEQLRKETVELTAKANAMRLDSETGKPKEQLAKIVEVHKLEREKINPQYLQIDQLEAGFKALQGQMALLKVRQSSSQDRIAAAQGIIDGIKGEGDEAKRGLKAVRSEAGEALNKARAALAASQQEIEKTMANLGKLCDEAAKADAEAAKAFERSINLLKSALTGADKPGNVNVARAETLVGWAENDFLALRMQSANAIFLDQIGKAWVKGEGAAAAADTPETTPASQPVLSGNLPPSAKKVFAYMTKPGELRDEATQRCTEAVELYKKAIQVAPAANKWIYQGGMGAAYALLGRLAAEPAARQEAMVNAQAALTEALQGKEASPYLAPIADLQKSLTQLQSQP